MDFFFYQIIIKFTDFFHSQGGSLNLAYFYVGMSHLRALCSLLLTQTGASTCLLRVCGIDGSTAFGLAIRIAS